MRYASQTGGPEQFYSGIRGEHKTLQKLRREQIWLRYKNTPRIWGRANLIEMSWRKL